MPSACNASQYFNTRSHTLGKIPAGHHRPVQPYCSFRSIIAAVCSEVESTALKNRSFPLSVHIQAKSGKPVQKKDFKLDKWAKGIQSNLTHVVASACKRTRTHIYTHTHFLYVSLCIHLPEAMCRGMQSV